MPDSLDVAIYVLTDIRQMDRTDHFTSSLAYMHGVNIAYLYYPYPVSNEALSCFMLKLMFRSDDFEALCSEL